MRHAISKHLRDFLAIAALAALALAVAGYILASQRFHLPAWVPLAGTDFYVVEGELQTAQAVVPGQGQTVNIAGVPVGEVGKVRLDRGRGVVEMKIRRRYAPIRRDATILLRPRTGLKDMYLQLDPGTQAAGELPEGGSVAVRNTLPDVNPDEILAELDGDTRAYLTVLLNAGGEAFEGERGAAAQASRADAGATTAATGEAPGTRTASASLRETFKRFEPASRDLAAIVREVSKRRAHLRRLVHNFQLLANAVGERDADLAALIDSADANFRALANQEASLRESLRLLPPALETTRDTLASARGLGRELGAATSALRPAARDLGPALRETRPFLRETEPIVREQLRPFARDAQPTVRVLRHLSGEVEPTVPRLTRSFEVVNSLLDLLAHDPPGAGESYLFYASWLNHNAASLFAAQDAHGPIRRGLFLASCPSLGVLEQIGETNPGLQVLIDLLNAPKEEEVCAP